jgi:hypothetical protein
MEVSVTLSRLGLSLLLAMPIGWEREFSHKAAGLRTHLLVSLGCCLFMLVSIYVSQEAGFARSDPARIAAQIVTGIGFLGGGAGPKRCGAGFSRLDQGVAAIGARAVSPARRRAVGTFIVVTTVSSWGAGFW